MPIMTGLSKESSAFANGLKIENSNTSEKAAENNATIKSPDQRGDKVTISKEARTLAAPEKQGTTLEIKKKKEQQPEESPAIKALKDRIKKLEKEIKELKEGDLPPDEKNKKVLEKQSELAQIRDQLAKAQKEALKNQGLSANGGTRANGFSKSLT